MMPSCRNAISIEFHTRGLGSAMLLQLPCFASDQFEVCDQAQTRGTGF